MSTIFLATDYEDTVGVYSTLDLAKAAVEEAIRADILHNHYGPEVAAGRVPTITWRTVWPYGEGDPRGMNHEPGFERTGPLHGSPVEWLPCQPAIYPMELDAPIGAAS